MLRESIAIIGGGYGGIGCAFHLRRNSSRFRGRVCLFDRVLPLQSANSEPRNRSAFASGWSASSVSVGMIHPLSPSGKILPLGELAFDAAKASIAYALGDARLARDGCIAKIFMSQAELDKFMSNVKAHSQWIETAAPPDETTKSSIFRGAVGAAKMQGSLVINSEEFIGKFWSKYKLEMKEALDVSHSAVSDLQSLSLQHDVVVVAAGAGIISLWGDPLPMLSCVKGQSLVYSGTSFPVPAAWPWLRSALVPGGYVVWRGEEDEKGKKEGHKSQIIIGATYEYGVDMNGSAFCPVNGAVAMDLLLNRGRMNSSLSEQFLGSLSSCSGSVTPPSVRAAYRVTAGRTDSRSSQPQPPAPPHSSPSHPRGRGALPVILRHRSLRNVFAVTGFASRGLLYHALTGKFLISALLDGDYSTIPHEMYIDTNLI